jgi:hypothetical protein
MMVFQPQRWYKWFLIALLVKGCFFAFMLHTRYFYEIEGFWGASNGDMYSYINPVESLLRHQGYTSDDRLPGYAAPYLLLRLVFEQPTALNILILAQLLLACLSVWALAKTAFDWFGTKTAFYVTFYGYLFSSLANVFEHYILTESFAASSVVFWLYFLNQFEKHRQKRYLLASGAFMTWLIFLKPAYGGMLIFPLLVWGGQFLQKRRSFKQLVQHSLLFLLPFMIIEGAWVARNYRHYNHQFVPLAKVMLYPASFWPTNYFPTRDFVQAWGGDVCFWFAHSDVRWLMGYGNNVFLPPVRWNVAENLGPPPAFIYTSQFNADSLRLIRQNVSSAMYDSLTAAQKASKEQAIARSLEKYRASIKTEKPFVFYVVAPLRTAYHFLTGTFGYQFLDDIIEAQWPRWGLRAYHFILLLLGGAGLIWLFFANASKPNLQSLVWLSAIYPIILFNFVFRHGETRYLVPAWPCWLLAAGFFVSNLRAKLGYLK